MITFAPHGNSQKQMQNTRLRWLSVTVALLGCSSSSSHENLDGGSTGPSTTSSVTSNTSGTTSGSTNGTANTSSSSSTGATNTATIGSTTTTTTTSSGTTGMGGSSSVGGMGGSSSIGGTGGSGATGAGGMPTVSTEDSTTGAGGTQNVGFQPCPTDEPCRILPLGDSITDGFGTPGGYRIELFSLALAAGKDITFVGGSSNGPSTVDGVAFPQSHEGHSGWTIQQIDDITPSPSLGPDPHIILLHIGTYDMSQGAAGADARLASLVDEILENAPDALLVVSTIIPFPGIAAVDGFNAAVPGIVSERADAGAHIIFADQFTGFPTSELADGVHPNPDGYARMADVWYETIEGYLP